MRARRRSVVTMGEGNGLSADWVGRMDASTGEAHGDLHDVPGAPSGGRTERMPLLLLTTRGRVGMTDGFFRIPDLDRGHTGASRSLSIPSRERPLSPRPD